MAGFPDITGFYDMLYGTAGLDFCAVTLLYFGGASGIVFSGNPPFTVTDFLSIYAKFGGPPSNIKGDITQGSNIVNNVSPQDLAGLSSGQLLVNINFPKDCLIIDKGSSSFTVTQASTITQTQANSTVYETPFVPMIILLTYVNLALASVMSSRYRETWLMAMSYFIAHYCTLWLRTESGSPSLTARQVAATGLTKGIIISRSAGDVSATSRIVSGYEQWGAWNETEYGVQFITLARAINCGPIYVP